MNASHRWLAATFVLLTLAACGGGPEQAQEPPPVKDTVFGDMVGTMDKARAVEGTVQQQKEALDRTIESAETEH